MALETGLDPPLHGKCHLKFPFWFSAHLPYRQGTAIIGLGSDKDIQKTSLLWKHKYSAPFPGCPSHLVEHATGPRPELPAAQPSPCALWADNNPHRSQDLPWRWHQIDSNQIFIASIQAFTWGLCSCKMTTSLQLKLVRFHRDLKRCQREGGLCQGAGLLSGGDQLWSEDRGSQDFAIHRYLFNFFKYLKWLVSVRLYAKVSN